MKQLLVIDKKDYSPDMPRFKRPSVRAIIMRNDKIAMVHSLKYDYYKFPGGGLENGESHADTLKREVLEETGLSIIANSIREFGSIFRVQKSLCNENEIFEQENFYYLCDVEGAISSQNLDDYENEERFTLEFVSSAIAIDVNINHNHFGYDSVLIERETRVLELIEKHI